jgi:hypothetical protein
MGKNYKFLERRLRCSRHCSVPRAGCGAPLNLLHIEYPGLLPRSTRFVRKVTILVKIWWRFSKESTIVSSLCMGVTHGLACLRKNIIWGWDLRFQQQWLWKVLPSEEQSYVVQWKSTDVLGKRVIFIFRVEGKNPSKKVAWSRQQAKFCDMSTFPRNVSWLSTNYTTWYHRRQQFEGVWGQRTEYNILFNWKEVQGYRIKSA